MLPPSIEIPFARGRLFPGPGFRVVLALAGAAHLAVASLEAIAAASGGFAAFRPLLNGYQWVAGLALVASRLLAEPRARALARFLALASIVVGGIAATTLVSPGTVGLAGGLALAYGAFYVAMAAVFLWAGFLRHEKEEKFQVRAAELSSTSAVLGPWLELELRSLRRRRNGKR